jgi:hypothetical protein
MIREMAAADPEAGDPAVIDRGIFIDVSYLLACRSVPACPHWAFFEREIFARIV